MLAGPGSAWASPVSDEVPADEEIRAGSVLPALRRPITFTTSDGVRLIGEVAVPVGRPAVATLVCVHPLPTHGGMMDSHLLRKAAWRCLRWQILPLFDSTREGPHRQRE